jgi:hypothetical protein
MAILRLAYSALFLIAVMAVFEVWSQVGGQNHLDLMPWYFKLALGGAAAFSIVKATAAAVSADRAWNPQTLRWLGILLVLMAGCGLASYYYHVYGEQPDEEDETVTSGLKLPHDRMVVTLGKAPAHNENAHGSGFYRVDRHQYPGCGSA